MANRDHGIPRDASRRAFIATAGGAAGSAWLAGMLPSIWHAAEAAAAAHDTGAAFTHLEPAEAAGLEAIAARIIPSDDTPGAREAGVIHFIDQSLGGFMAAAAPDLRAGLAALDTLAAEARAGGRFEALGAADQDALLGQVQDTPFFELMHFLTIAGMFALPRYGGNRNHLGWQLLGLSQQHAWAPPFGHYDAESTGQALRDAHIQGGHDHG